MEMGGHEFRSKWMTKKVQTYRFSIELTPCVSLGVLNNRGNGITIGDADGKPMIDLGANGSEAAAVVSFLIGDFKDAGFIDANAHCFSRSSVRL